MRALYRILALLTAVCMALALTACTRGVSPVLETAGDDFDVIDVVEEAVSAQPPAQEAAGTPVSVTGSPSAKYRPSRSVKSKDRRRYPTRRLRSRPGRSRRPNRSRSRGRSPSRSPSAR